MVPFTDMCPRLLERFVLNEESTFRMAQSSSPVLYQRFGDAVRQPLFGTSTACPPSVPGVASPVVTTTWKPSSCGHVAPEHEPVPLAWNWRSKLLAIALCRHDDWVALS